MNTYPRDEFDDVEENSSRRGAYRGRVTDTSTSRAGLLAVIISGILALLVGGIMYVVSPRTAGPGTTTAPASARATATATADASPSTNPASVTVAVYNSSAPEGSASTAASVLQKANYKITETTNWTGTYATESMVYFATGASSEANEVADLLGIAYINQDFQAETGEVYVVLGADFDPTALAEQTQVASADAATSTATEDSQLFYVYDPVNGTYTATSKTEALASGKVLYRVDPATGAYVEYSGTDASSPASATTGTATQNTQRYSLDPATGTYVLDPAGAYIYDSATGTYTQG
ncbi:LytR C-terminal domain-containing protein [Rothia sp. CCM 9417]|uniref:LytR C-terminal domain-containing protein n=1 Tax=Rothia sp. CCM 9417 TaxID=3402657 RepID=UPI003AE32798